MQRDSVTAPCLVALVVLSAVAVAAPATATPTTATPTDTPSSASATLQADAPADDQYRTYNDTAILALEDAGDGAVVAGGQTGLRNANATLLRVDADGDVAWRRTFTGPNATRVVDVVVADAGDVYALVTEQSPAAGVGQRTSGVDLLRVGPDGDVRWRQSIAGSVPYDAGLTMTESDDGVALAYRLADERGVRLAEYAGGDAIWAHTYQVDARPTSLRKTTDGYLLAGATNFDGPWVVRTTESGRPRLNVTLSGIDVDRVAGAVPTDDGGAVLAGDYRPGFTGEVRMAWTARVGGDGLTEWTRTYEMAGGAAVSSVFETDDGLLLAGQNPVQIGAGGATQLLGVGLDGARLFGERVDAATTFTAVTRTDGTLTAGGIARYDRDGFASALETVAIPDATGTGGATGTDAALAADVGVTSSGTVYSGQNVRVADPGGAGDTYHLVKLPGERETGDPQVVRRVTLDGDDAAVIETALLAGGTYALRTPEGQPVALDDGRITGPATREEAAFAVRVQHFFHVETNRTFVNAAAGERDVSLALDAGRSDYAVHVSVADQDGEPVDADALRRAFGDVDGFDGIETVHGQPAARIAVDERARLNASVAAFGPGLYQVTVSGADTRDGGAIAATRVVVGNATDRRLGLSLGNRTLTVPAGAETATNVTLSNVSRGISAMGMSASRTGDPAIGLSVDIRINASRASGSAGIGPHEATAGATAFGGDTPNGTVTVGQLRVSTDNFGRDPIANGTNTVRFHVDWVVDESGVPYALPNETTVTVVVTDAGNETAEGPATASGSASGERTADVE